MSETKFDCNEVTPFLNEIWSVFRQAGVTDDLVIFESFAFFLLLKHVGVWETFSTEIKDFQEGVFQDFPIASTERWFSGLFESSKLIPKPPSELNYLRLAEIVEIFERLFPILAPGSLLNECVLFRLEKMQRGGRYATPRHITRLMADLADIEQGMSLADFACGSGGLLVAAAEKMPHVTGIEISPNWARIAWANAILHNLPTPDIRIQNAYEWLGKPDPKFDRVLMNPPFGEKVDRSYLETSVGSIRGGRSETVFTRLGLDMLKGSGKMAILAPSGLLFSASRGERVLRQDLLEHNILQAVIQLPEDAFQPYSQLRTYLILVEKPGAWANEPIQENIRFYDLRHDGFTSGRNRQPEPELNEIPRLVAAFFQKDTNPDLELSMNNRPVLGVQHIRNGKPYGYYFTYPAGHTVEIQRVTRTKIEMPALLAYARDDRGQQGAVFIENSDHWYLSEGVEAPTRLKLPFVKPREADLRIILDDGTERELRLHPKGGQIGRRRNQGQLCPHNPDRGREYKVLLLNHGGRVIAGAFTLPNQNLPRDMRADPIAIFPVETREREPVGNLLLLYNTRFNAQTFRGEQKQMLELARAGDSHIIFRLNAQNQLTDIEIAQVSMIYRSAEGHTGLAVDQQGDWFGVQVARKAIAEREFSLQPDTYFPTEAEVEPLRSPAEILADVKLNQIALHNRVDSLLGIIEQNRGIQRTPPGVASPLNPIGTLTPLQKEIWETVHGLSEYAGSANERYRVPRPFQPEDLDEFPLLEVEKTIELLLAMGIIVPITINNAPYYRLLSEADVIHKS